MQTSQLQLAQSTKLFSVSTVAKWTTVSALSLSLLAASALPVAAGAPSHGKSSGGRSVIKKSVKARAGGKVRLGSSGGGSRSTAVANNGITVNIHSSIGGGSGRGSVTLNRGGSHKANNRNNHNNNNGHKKVVRKNITRKTVNNTYNDYSTTGSYNTSSADTFTDIYNETNIVKTNIQDSYNTYCPTCYPEPEPDCPEEDIVYED